MVEMERNYITADYFRSIQMGKMPDGKVLYTLDGRPVTEEPEGTVEEKHYKRIINQVSGYVREVCSQMTQTVPKAVVHCMVLQVGAAGAWGCLGAGMAAWCGLEVGAAACRAWRSMVQHSMLGPGLQAGRGMLCTLPLLTSAHGHHAA